VELTEVVRQLKADEQRPQAERKHMAACAEVKVSDAHDEQICDDRVEEAPENVDR
jgi:hypothetical protein